MSSRSLFDWLAGMGEKIVPLGSPLKVAGELCDLRETPGNDAKWLLKLDSPTKMGDQELSEIVIEPSADLTQSLNGKKVHVEGRLVRPGGGARPFLKAARIEPLDLAAPVAAAR